MRKKKCAYILRVLVELKRPGLQLPLEMWRPYQYMFDQTREKCDYRIDVYRAAGESHIERLWSIFPKL